MILTLHTVTVRPDGCFSVLLWNGVPFAVSVERTFEDGRPVIENGMHSCVRDFYHKGGYETFEIIVPDHDRILFHKGNVEAQSLGCVLVAESFGKLEAQTAVLQSSAGFAEFMALTKGIDQFTLEVIGR